LHGQFSRGSDSCRDIIPESYLDNLDDPFRYFNTLKIKKFEHSNVLEIFLNLMFKKQDSSSEI
jgi:hypothetical protein